MPSGQCGPKYVLLKLDDTDRIEEVVESNNFFSIPVFIACVDGT